MATPTRYSAKAFASILIALSIFLPEVRNRSSRSTHAKTISQAQALTLNPGASVDGQMSGGESRFYELELEKDQFVHLVVYQKGIDVTVSLWCPEKADREPCSEVDRPSGTRGPEAISWITNSKGTYRIGIHAYDKRAALADYSITFDKPRPPRPEDRPRIRAESLVARAEKDRNVATAQSLSSAIENFNKAIKEWEGLGETYEIAVALHGLAWSHNVLCQYEEAITHFERAVGLQRQLSNPFGQAVSQTGLAYAYLYLGDNKKALVNFREALSLHQSLNNPRGEAVTLYGIGSVQLITGDAQEALENFRKSLTLREQVQDQAGKAITLSGIGKAYRRLGQFDEALSPLKEALQIIQASKNPAVEADTLANLGWVYWSLLRNEDALQAFKDALPKAKLVGDPGGQAMTLYGMARVYDRQGELEAARKEMFEALQIIESLRDSVSSEELRTSYFASVQDYYEFYVDLLMRLGQLNPKTGYKALALQVNERARARNLLDILTEAHANIRRGVDPELLASESRLRKDLNAKLDYHLRLQSAANPPADQLTALNSEIEDLQRRFDDVERAIRKSSPRLAALRQPRPLSLSGIQTRVLDRQTVLLEYALGSERAYLWVVTSDSIRSISLIPSPAVIRETADRFIRMLKESGGSEQNLENLAQKLSGMLIPPEAVSAIARRHRVMVVADGILQGLPFGALSVTTTAHKYLPLVESHEVVSLPSASTLAIIRTEIRGRKQAPRSVMVLADPVFSDHDDRLTRQPSKPSQDDCKDDAKVAAITTQSQIDLVERLRSSDVQTRSGINLERLCGTRREAIRIQRLVPTARVALDFGASLKTALDPDLRHYRIIHFATHGLAPDSHPELSGVVLSLFNSEGHDQEGYLGLPLVYNLDLPVEMVVLSACETGLGETIRGEGLIGLTRGFMYAGSPRVVASYWKVSEGGTEELMKRFYEGMFQTGLRPAAALSAAQASMWNDQSWSMSDWAGFAFFGEPR